MSEATATLRFGRVLFRLRSLTPLPVLGLILWLLYRSRGTVTPVDTVLLVAGPLVAMLGQAIRFYTVGWVPEGTSGQNDRLEASTLNTRGPYAYVRNPLYVGNLLLCVGLMLVARDAAAALVGLVFFFGEYFFIIRAEEDFLRQKFGERFEQYTREVPRWLPRLSAASSGRLREGDFDWRRGLKKEHNPFAAWSLGMLALLAWEQLARGAAISALWPWAALAGLVLLLFVAVKGWKHGWLARSA